MGIEEGSLGGDSLAFCPAMWSWGQSAGINTIETETWTTSWSYSGEKRKGNREEYISISSLKPISAVTGISSYLCHSVRLSKTFLP